MLISKEFQNTRRMLQVSPFPKNRNKSKLSRTYYRLERFEKQKSSRRKRNWKVKLETEAHMFQNDFHSDVCALAPRLEALIRFQRTFCELSTSSVFSLSREYLLANSVQSTRRGISLPSLLSPPLPLREPRDVRKENSDSDQPSLPLYYTPTDKLSSRFLPIKRNKPSGG